MTKAGECQASRDNAEKNSANQANESHDVVAPTSPNESDEGNGEDTTNCILFVSHFLNGSDYCEHGDRNGDDQYPELQTHPLEVAELITASPRATRATV